MFIFDSFSTIPARPAPKFIRWRWPLAAALFFLCCAVPGSIAWGQAPNYGQYTPAPTGSIPVPPSFAPNTTPPEVAAAEAAPEATSWTEIGLIKRIAAGGWLMIPLGLCSLIVLSLSFERMLALRRSRVIPRPFVRRFTECVEDGQLSYEEATTICEEFDCPVAEVFQAAVKRWGRPMLEIEQAVMDAGDRVADGLRRFLRVFHAISNVAPLIGLLENGAGHDLSVRIDELRHDEQRS